jgi:hypothetical protein
MTWTGAPLEDSEITKALNRIVFESEDDGPSEQIIEIGKLDQILGTQIPNTSMPWHALFSPQVDKLGTYLRKNLSQREVEKGLNFLYDTRNAIPQEIGTAHSSLSAKEVELGIDFSIFALEKSMGILLGRETLPSTNPDAMIERYDALWLERARPGGLTESKQLLKEALKRKS